jgi:hypothetical protein
MAPLLRYIRSFGDSENRAFLEEPVKSMKALLRVCVQGPLGNLSQPLP